MRSLIAAAALLAAVSTASGANLVYERYTIEVEPGSVQYFQVVSENTGGFDIRPDNAPPQR